jgi:hypothetical protein
LERNKQRFVNLGWFILQSKYCYYLHPNYKHLNDTEYDQIEDEYRQLAITLGLVPTATNMVGFDLNRPSCILVKERLDKLKTVDFELLKII